MNKLYIVFDQIPSPKAGGLLATYINLVELLKSEYNIEIISVFDCNEENKKLFSQNKIHILFKRNIDIRFYKIIKYLKRLQFKKTIKSIYSSILYFLCIPFAKNKIKKLIKSNDKIIVTCPSAAIFLSKKIKFILEIHTDYKYFFGNNFLGKMQSKMMTKPTLILFRTKSNAKEAPKYLNSNYIYNFFDNSKNNRSKKLIKNKILYIGRLEKQKNPIKLVNMAYKLSKINDNFILDIYGSGSMVDDVKEEIKKSKLENKVFYKGFTTNKNIYNKYSLLWLTSDIEGFGLVIIEAKACGIPTVSTNWGKAAYEVIENKKDGYITNDNEEFVELTNKILTNEQLQKKLSDNAYKNFDKFSKEKAKERWINFLENYKK